MDWSFLFNTFLIVSLIGYGVYRSKKHPESYQTFKSVAQPAPEVPLVHQCQSQGIGLVDILIISLLFGKK